MKNACLSMFLLVVFLDCSPAMIAREDFQAQANAPSQCKSSIDLAGWEIAAAIGRKTDDPWVKKIFAKLSGKAEEPSGIAQNNSGFMQHKFRNVGLYLSVAPAAYLDRSRNLAFERRVWDAHYSSGSSNPQEPGCKFPGTLPLDLNWNMSRSAVKEKLGDPNEKDAFVPDVDESLTYVVSGLRYQLFFWLKDSKDGELRSIYVRAA